MFLIAACGTPQTVEVGDQKYLGGNDGVIVSFEPIGVEEDGVETIYDDEIIRLEVVLKNKGEHEVAADTVDLKLLGPAQALFEDVAAWEISNAGVIDSVSEFNTEGGEEIVTFSTDGRYVNPITGFTDLQWFVNYAYDYRTEAIVSDVCFKEDLTDTRVCTVEEIKNIEVSGAPIQVTSVEEDTAGRAVPVLVFEISNVAGGDVTLQGEEFNNRFGTVAYSIDEADRWECKSGGRINEARLIDGKATIRCKLKEALPGGELSTKEVKFTLDYAYQDIVQQTLRVKESSS
tara:strand:- start:564 stop:1430 length:867 start_codon:yes stop_codon:yes gene_type:complete